MEVKDQVMLLYREINGTHGGRIALNSIKVDFQHENQHEVIF